eukprot:scaffold14647_cov60-Phaeocystis_antarctica.AAC.7
MSGVLPMLVRRSTLAPRSSSIFNISNCSHATATCIRPKELDMKSGLWRPSAGRGRLIASTGPPPSNHSTTFCSSPRPADCKISPGTTAGTLGGNARPADSIDGDRAAEGGGDSGGGNGGDGGGGGTRAVRPLSSSWVLLA